MYKNMETQILYINLQVIHTSHSKRLCKRYMQEYATNEDSVVITSCATESNSWVLRVCTFDYILTGRKNHIIISEVEHPSIIATAKFLESKGCKVTYLTIVAGDNRSSYS